MTASGSQTSSVFRQPVMVRTSQNGIKTESRGRIRPQVPLSASTSSPVTALKVRSGVPIPPQATGAVLAIKQSKAA